MLWCLWCEQSRSVYEFFKIYFHTLDMQNCKNCEQNVFVRFNQCCVCNGRCSLQLLFESFELYLSFCLVLQEFRWLISFMLVNSKLTTHAHAHDSVRPVKTVSVNCVYVLYVYITLARHNRQIQMSCLVLADLAAFGGWQFWLKIFTTQTTQTSFSPFSNEKDRKVLINKNNWNQKYTKY